MYVIRPNSSRDNHSHPNGCGGIEAFVLCPLSFLLDDFSSYFLSLENRITMSRFSIRLPGRGSTKTYTSIDNGEEGRTESLEEFLLNEPLDEYGQSPAKLKLLLKICFFLLCAALLAIVFLLYANASPKAHVMQSTILTPVPFCRVDSQNSL
jgi:hypothetical protein